MSPQSVLHAQDKRQQMMNDVRALCDAPHVPGLVDFVGAYHESETGQVCAYYNKLCIGIWQRLISLHAFVLSCRITVQLGH